MGQDCGHVYRRAQDERLPTSVAALATDKRLFQTQLELSVVILLPCPCRDRELCCPMVATVLLITGIAFGLTFQSRLPVRPPQLREHERVLETCTNVKVRYVISDLCIVYSVIFIVKMTGAKQPISVVLIYGNMAQSGRPCRANFQSAGVRLGF